MFWFGLGVGIAIGLAIILAFYVFALVVPWMGERP